MGCDELWINFYLGAKWEFRGQEPAFQIALRNCPEEAQGKVRICDFGEGGGIHAIKHKFLQTVAASHVKVAASHVKITASYEEQASPWKMVLLF